MKVAKLLSILSSYDYSSKHPSTIIAHAQHMPQKVQQLRKTRREAHNNFLI